MDSVLNLNLWQMASAYIFVLVLLAIVKIKGISREKEIIISTIRMTLQLILTGYILSYIFQNSNAFYTIFFMILMELFAIYNTFKRVKVELSKQMKFTIGISMISGTLITILYFIFVVLRLVPWFEPRYFIPIGGMIIGNSMTGISLGVTKLVDGMTNKRDLVEMALMLGATPKAASKSIVDSAFDSSILPTINSMVGMGIVFLPGMMTGQILSGVSPFTAIEYQIAIMLGILGSVALTVIMFVQLGYKTFFNEEDQLNI
ncbi:putative iron export permease protein FetB [Clostridium homopropionicum DSM 5847]|uniref:Putative iron export permease protein FetB n=1 Tax=Clostridium homopropionicum DSM 5847 TaxID=1121318 RepID=A0A0L6Z580_9CLOT|nr:iron export ABC transporter permease subunit FetB [Clostridium homopropionicum]KOA18115.1 putative iron export permease protein FetB [Clostridium homopropionicum DSM 5847]SFG72340.1 putative ABC transport system permease protein [Clostridium homopropionicum]